MAEKKKIVLVRTSLLKQQGIGIHSFLYGDDSIAAIGLLNTKSRHIDGYLVPVTEDNKEKYRQVQEIHKAHGFPVIREQHTLSTSFWLVGRNHRETGGGWGEGRRQLNYLVRYTGFDSDMVLRQSFIMTNNNLGFFLDGFSPDNYQLTYHKDDMEHEYPLSPEVEGLVHDLVFGSGMRSDLVEQAIPIEKGAPVSRKPGEIIRHRGQESFHYVPFGESILG